jgi:(R,R)-butanediol dehydrogenase/meso-butanediol dehydrogenase/diacetyl reductase
MVAVVYRGPGALEVTTIDLPEIGAADVLVEVSHCGICGTDLHSVLEGWGQPGSIGGHEWSGLVTDVGAEVENCSPGDRVIGIAKPGCGACRLCIENRPSLCIERASPGVDSFQGAFADFIATPADSVMRIPDDLSLREAALAEPLAVALHAISRANISAGQRLLISGAGPIGLAAAAVLAAQDVSVMVSEPASRRRDLVERLGVEAIDPSELTVPVMPNELVTDPFDAVIECSGKREAIEIGIAQLGRTGRCVIVGTGMDYPRLDINRVLLNELEVTGAYNYDADGFERAVGLLSSGGLSTDVLIEPGSVGLSELLDVMQGLAAGEIGGKVLVTPQSGDQGRDDQR